MSLLYLSISSSVSPISFAADVATVTMRVKKAFLKEPDPLCAEPRLPALCRRSLVALSGKLSLLPWDDGFSTCSETAWPLLVPSCDDEQEPFDIRGFVCHGAYAVGNITRAYAMNTSCILNTKANARIVAATIAEDGVLQFC